MNQEQFEEVFDDFYVDFGYVTIFHASDSTKTLMMSGQFDKLIFQVETQHIPCRYYVVLTWKTLEVGRCNCTQIEYDSRRIPPQIIDMAESFIPPIA
jgi:hypothetical protein